MLIFKQYYFCVHFQGFKLENPHLRYAGQGVWYALQRWKNVEFFFNWSAIFVLFGSSLSL